MTEELVEQEEALPTPVPWHASWNPSNIKRWISLSKNKGSWNKTDQRPNSSASKIFKIFERLENEIGEKAIIEYLMRPEVADKARRAIPELAGNPQMADTWYKYNPSFPPCIKSILLDLTRDLKYGRLYSSKKSDD